MVLERLKPYRLYGLWWVGIGIAELILLGTGSTSG